MYMANVSGKGWHWRIPESPHGSAFTNNEASEYETTGVRGENQLGRELVPNYTNRLTYTHNKFPYPVKNTQPLFDRCDCEKYKKELKEPGGWQ
jgi:hypothetical protein